MTRPKRPGRRLFQILLFTVYCPLSTLSSCSFEITASRYALVYGAANYDNLLPSLSSNLQYTDDDARDMAAELAAAGWTVRQVREPTVNKTDILGDIADLIGDVEPDSSVLVYFSGHGTDYLGTTYILPTDAITSGGSAVVANFISPSELLSALDTLSCRNRILILDTCYSGGFVTDTGTLDAAPQNYGVYDDGTDGSAILAALGSYSDLLAAAFESYDPATPVVVTAAGAEELSYEGSVDGDGNGIFTRYFVLAATRGDLDGNGMVTLQEAYRYAREGVETYWNSAYYNWYSIDPDTDETYPFWDYLPRISGNARDVVIF